jgi:hypothetical protein
MLCSSSRDETMGTFNTRSTNHFVLRKQHLTEDTKTDNILQIVNDIIGLHATNPATAYLSLFARTCSFSKQQLDDELYIKRNLGKIRCMRKTLHILPKELILVAYSATKRIVEITSERYSQNVGVTRKQYMKTSKAILELLKGRGMTTKEIKNSLKSDVNISSVVNLMCDQGLLIRGNPRHGWKSNIHTYYRFKDYFSDLDLAAVDEEKSKELLIRQYLASFGPVTANDIVWWTGLLKRDVTRVLEKLQNQLSQVEIANLKGDYLMLSSDLRTFDSLKSERHVLNFLPNLDPYLMGYKERERYLNPEHYDYVFDRSGNGTSTILLDGRVIGVWDVAKSEPLVKLFFFEVKKSVLDDARAMARKVGKFIVDEDVQVTVCDSMVPLTRRTAGGFMSPLKGC